MIEFKPITQEKFNQFVNSNLKLWNTYKGAFYPLKSLNQLIYFTDVKNINPLKRKILNRKATYIYETIKDNFYFALIKYENNDQYLSIKKLLETKQFKNRYDNLFLYNNILDFTNESKRRS